MNNEGWICPRCGRVNAPWYPWCNCEPVSNKNANTSELTPIRDYMVKPIMTGDRPTLTDCEEVFDRYTDTAGNLNWIGTKSGKHILRAESEGEK